MLKVVHEESESQQHVPAAVGGSWLDELARDGARQMLAAALLAEVAAYVDAHRGEVDENGHRLLSRNGLHDPREVATAAGAVPVRQPRVNDKRIDEGTGELKRFSSAILPAWARKSPGGAEILPRKVLREAFPDTEEQRRWWHRLGNVLAARPKPAHPGAKAALSEVYHAEDKDHAIAAAQAFAADHGAKWPKAVAKVIDDLDVLLAFYDYPAEHWIHLRTTNPREHLRHRASPAARHQGPRLAGRRHRHGVQAHRVRPEPLARRQRTPPRRPRPRRRGVQERQTRRTTRRIRR